MQLLCCLVVNVAAPFPTAMATALPSVFKNKNVFNAKVLEKVEACSWASQPLVLRLINRDQQEIMAIASDAAKTNLAHIEKGVVYNFIVPGACVKKSDPEKTGVDCTLELRLRNHAEAAPALEGWPAKVPFNFTRFIDLAQLPDQTWVDVVGFVHRDGDVTRRVVTQSGGASYTLLSREIMLQSGDFHETLELLGEHSALRVKVGDVVAVRQAKLTTWNQVRKLSTGIVTHLIINPTAEDEVLSPVKLEDPTSPTKKAAGMKEMTEVTLAEVAQQRDALLRKVREEGASPKLQVFHGVTHASYIEYDDSIFETGYPFYGTDENPLMKIPAVLQDSHSHRFRVTLWNDACNKLFEVDASSCVDLWGHCESASGKQQLLERFNRHTGKTFKFWLTLSVWCPDDDISKAMIRASVNQITDVSAP